MNTSFMRALLAALAATFALPFLVLLCSQLGAATPEDAVRWSAALPGAIAIALIALTGIVVLVRWRGALDRAAADQARFLDLLPISRVPISILGAAALSLFLELVMIRWQGSVFETFAFYKNYTLLACFLGLGLGYALARRDAIPLVFTIPSLALQMLVMLILRHGLTQQGIASILVTPVVEQLNMGYGVAYTIPSFLAVNCFLLVILLLTALTFIPVGQLCGRLMERQENLPAYGWNLLGSLAGVVLIFLVSFLWTPPVVWFSLCFLVLLWFQAFSMRVLATQAALAFAAIAILAWPVSVGSERIYSPYQLLERGTGEAGDRDNRGLMFIRAAGHYYQRVHDLAFSNANRNQDAKLAQVAAYYELPYTLHPGELGKVAIVGSGTGNDVAAALRMGAREVDAIEIDPAILKLGTIYHPEKPYQDPRVTAVVNDARSFFRTTPEKYDLVVYGLLDSHTLLSHASSVRLDSFVYTVEGFREAGSILNQGGMLSLSFSVLSDEIGRKIYLMLTQAFPGSTPVCVQARYDGSVIFFHRAGGDVEVDPRALSAAGFEDVTAKYASPDIVASVSTDDWPFFYVPKRVYPTSYVVVLGLMLLMSLALTVNFFGQQMALGHPSFFFLGAGFMLVETKGITEMGLTFGNTWQVVGIVIIGILLMAYLANAWVQRVGVKRPLLPLICLMATLLAGWWVARQGGLPSTFWGRVATVLVLTIPMFFSGLAFSSLLRSARAISGVMAINMLGAMLGGVLEYNSMYFGFQFLYLLAFGLYAAALLSVLFVRFRA